MRLNILIAGAAGQGINEISNILAKSLASMGYYIFNYREYGSLITGGHNFNILSFSDYPIFGHENDFDYVIALNEDAIKKHKLRKDTIVFAAQDYKVNNLIKVQIDNPKIENAYYAAALFKSFGFDKEILKDFMKKVFHGKPILEEDLKAVDSTYEREHCKSCGLKKLGKKNFVFTGAEAVGIAAIESGLQVYLGYPMTPSTSMLTFFAQNQAKYDYLVHEPENEIAVANAALGSSYTGAVTMIGTAGGGYDLMTEALSMQGQAELPLVVYLAQRPGPSTGVPTYSMQTDLNVAVYGGHGEFRRIVVSPGDVEDCYRLTKEIFYLTQKYKSLGIILTDKHLAESFYTVEKLGSKKISLPSLKKVPGKDIVKASSYEHDEKGNMTEDASVIRRGFELRNKKWNEMRKEISKMNTYSCFGKGKKIIVGTGSVKGAILDALKDLKDYKYIHINYLEPFADIEKEIKGKDFYVIEESSTGVLADLIQRNLAIKVDEKKRILKYDARPFLASEIIKLLGKKK